MLSTSSEFNFVNYIYGNKSVFKETCMGAMGPAEISISEAFDEC